MRAAGAGTPLSGKRVLVTRPAHQNAGFAESLRAAGAEPVLAPTIEIGPPDDPAAAAYAVAQAAKYAWIVFTSANGVRVFFDLLEERREDARALGKANVAAIGIRTSQALRERGVFADLVPQTFVAEDLAEALVTASCKGDRLLIFRAHEARDVLPERLRAAGREADVVAAYRTHFVHDPELAQKVAHSDIVTFTSASTVSGFANALGGDDAARAALAGRIVACIGPITAQRANELGIHVDVVAQEYTAEGLMRALERLPSA